MSWLGGSQSVKPIGPFRIILEQSVDLVASNALATSKVNAALFKATSMKPMNAWGDVTDPSIVRFTPAGVAAKYDSYLESTGLYSPTAVASNEPEGSYELDSLITRRYGDLVGFTCGMDSAPIVRADTSFAGQFFASSFYAEASTLIMRRVDPFGAGYGEIGMRFYNSAAGSGTPFTNTAIRSDRGNGGWSYLINVRTARSNNVSPTALAAISRLGLSRLDMIADVLHPGGATDAYADAGHVYGLPGYTRAVVTDDQGQVQFVHLVLTAMDIKRVLLSIDDPAFRASTADFVSTLSESNPLTLNVLVSHAPIKDVDCFQSQIIRDALDDGATEGEIGDHVYGEETLALLRARGLATNFGHVLTWTSEARLPIGTLVATATETAPYVTLDRQTGVRTAPQTLVAHLMAKTGKLAKECLKDLSNMAGCSVIAASEIVGSRRKAHGRNVNPWEDIPGRVLDATAARRWSAIGNSVAVASFRRAPVVQVTA